MHLPPFNYLWKNRSEPVEAVEGSNLVGFGEGGIVEDRIAEVFDGAAHAEDDLPDVDDLSGAVSDDVHAKKVVFPL